MNPATAAAVVSSPPPLTASSWLSGIVRGRPSSPKMSQSGSYVGEDGGGGPVKGKNQFRGLMFKYGANPIRAPASDREYRATLPETAGMINLASTMIAEGRGSELMPKEADLCAPISAIRYLSLCSYMGDDDMFSSDLTDDQLRLKLGHMYDTPCQVIFSMADEYVPEYVDKKALVGKIVQSNGRGRESRD